MLSFLDVSMDVSNHFGPFHQSSKFINFDGTIPRDAQSAGLSSDFTEFHRFAGNSWVILWTLFLIKTSHLFASSFNQARTTWESVQPSFNIDMLLRALQTFAISLDSKRASHSSSRGSELDLLSGTTLVLAAIKFIVVCPLWDVVRLYTTQA